MKILKSKIFDGINTVLSLIQNKTDIIRKNSFILSNIDVFILISIVLTFVVSMFASTNLIGAVSFLVPILVVLKVLITKGEKIELEQCNFYLLIYFGICLLSNFTSSMLPQSLYGFMKSLIYFAFYFALCQFLKNNRRFIMLLLFVIGLIISIESFIGLFQSYIQVESIATWQDTSYVNPEDVLSRVYGTLKPYNPNLFGGYLIAGFSSLIALVSVYIAKKKMKSAIISIICFLTAVLCIFQTGCRGAYLALFVIFAGIVAASWQMVFCCFRNEKLKKLYNWFIALFTAGGLGFLALNHGILHRLMSIFILRGDSSTSFRINVYNSAIQMFHDNWLFGIGVGNKVFREIYGLYMLSGFDALSCYCVFLEIAVESGIFALLAYIAFILSLVIASIKKFILVKNFYYKVLIFTALISIIAVLVHGLFDTVYFRPQIQYLFWTMAAILTTLVRNDKLAE